jgi:hypothetical protein
LIAVAIVLVLLFSFQRLYKVATNHLNTPYDLEIESHNLATIKSIQDGKQIYDKSFYGDLPLIISIYNPLYHYLTASLPQNKTNPFFTGRLVSLMATILMLLLLLLPGYSDKTPKTWLAPLLAMSSILLLPIFLRSVVYLHPDMLALFFSGIAIVSIENASNRLTVILASLFGFLAFATKQNFLCATAGSFLFLCYRDRRKAILFMVTSAILYSTFFLFVQKFLGEGYWFSTFFSVLKHPSFLHLTIRRIGELLQQPMFDLLIVLAGISITYIALKERDAFNASPYLIYLVVTAVVPLFGLGKIGGEASYYLEFMLALSLWIVFFVRRFYSQFSSKYIIAFFVFFILVFGLELTFTKPSQYLLTDNPNNKYFKYNVPKRFDQEVQELQPQNDNFLVLNTHVMYPFLKKKYFNDPYNYFLMWNYGILDPRPMIKAIENKYFSVIMFASQPSTYSIPSMYPLPSGPGSANIVQAIQQNYRLRKVGLFSYFTPHRKINN